MTEPGTNGSGTVSEDRRLVPKVDLQFVILNAEFLFLTAYIRTLIPILFLLYLLSFLDRSNIGNARNSRLKDIHLSSSAYNTALALYFIAYVIIEVPSNIILKRSNLQLWLPTLTLAWGLVSVGQGLLGIRFLLGVTEAGLFSGSIFLFSMYYQRGIFAYAIGKMEGVGGRHGWQWIFIIEGILTVVVSLFAYIIVPTWPRTHNDERSRLLARLKADSDAGHDERFKYDHLVWAYALLFHVSPNALASISIWLTVWLSSKYNLRAPFIIASAIVAIIGACVLLRPSHTRTCIIEPGSQYTGVHFAAAGVYAGNALLLSWPGENVSGQTKRAIVVAMQITIGDLGAVAGVLIYRPEFASHNLRKPHIISIGYLLFAIANRQRALRLENKELHKEIVLSEERLKLGDRDVNYRYVL
ncbi:major facilitator superfamily domain-containing protein [Armillaria novae-zelandiae]|uniref:Major facilitator superfamily domain-containing protein n=1 Tax=Armillaria novae-zelandiae TaxID=153914 RepID=A0AA39UPQ0_9AGAR|nr:major facilitator superfamily domain-containing protein [Armillaria novae-zelandiae]